MSFGPFLSKEEIQRINAAQASSARVSREKGARSGKGTNFNPLQGPLDFLQEHIFYTKEKTKEINDALHTNSQQGNQKPPQVKPQQPPTRTQQPPARTRQPSPTLSLSPVRPNANGNYVVAGVEYDGTTHRPVGSPEGGYSLGSDGKMTAYAPPTPAEVPPTPAEVPPTPAEVPPTPAEVPPTPAEVPDAGDAMDGEGSLPADQPSGDTRTSPTGLVQRGMTLGGIKNYLQGTGLGLADASQYFQMGEPTYGSKVTGPNNEVLKPETHVWSEKAGGLIPPSTAGVTGKSPQDPQAGVSDVPDQADNSRALSLSGGEEPFGGTYGDDDEYVSPMYADKARNTWRSTYLDSRAKGPAALMREADASIGIIRDNKGNIAYKNGDSYSTYSGDGDTRDVIYDIRGGQSGFGKHQSDFTELGALEVPDTPTIKPDDEQTEATIEGAATIPWKDMNKGQKEDTVSAFAQDFANWYKQGVKDQNK